MRIGLGLGLGVTRGVPAFTPATISNVALWLDAGFGIGLGAGTNVASWADKSGQIATPTQATSAQQPTRNLTALNGLPGIAFTGIQNLPHTLRLQSPCTVAAVVSSTVDGSAGYAAVAAFGAGVGGTLLFAESGAGITQWGLYHSGDVLSGQSVRNSFKKITAVVRNYNDCDLRTNGASVTVTTGVSGYAAASLIGAGIGGGGQSLEGTICELVAYSRALTVPECQKIETYFASKYAI